MRSQRAENHGGIRVRAIAWAGVLLALSGACRPSWPNGDAADAQVDGMARASELQRSGSYAEAAQSYRAVLRKDPDNALAHCELGILLQDNQHDEAGAVYHFRNYLDLRPGSDKAPLVLEKLRQAETKLGQRFGGEDASSSRVVSDAQIVGRIEELNGLVAERDRTIQQLRDQSATLTRENERLAREIRSLNNRLDLVLDGTERTSKPPSPALRNMTLDDLAAVLPTPSAASPSPSPRRADRTYRVRRGDSLWSIAQKVYGNPSRSVDIRNANRRRIGTNDRLTEGSELVIPFP